MNRSNSNVVVAVVAACVAGLAGAGCAEEPLVGTFTSQVVQLESCRVVGEAPEGCSKDEAIAELQVDVVEAAEDTFWLYGLARGGVEDRAVLGSRDSVGGFLFVDESSESDGTTGCVLTERLELSLAVEAGRLPDVGTDDCIALVGRQIETTTTTAACDSTSATPQQIVRVVRQRWEPLSDTSTCGE